MEKQRGIISFCPQEGKLCTSPLKTQEPIEGAELQSQDYPFKKSENCWGAELLLEDQG